MDYFQNEFSTGVNSEGVRALTSGQTSLVVSILSAGTFFGTIPSSLNFLWEISLTVVTSRRSLCLSLRRHSWSSYGSHCQCDYLFHRCCFPGRLDGDSLDGCWPSNCWFRCWFGFCSWYVALPQTALQLLPVTLANRSSFLSVPMYQSESAPKWIRGTIVGCYQLAITIGLLLAACANQGTHNRNDAGSYRIPLAIQFVWAVILGVGMFLLPETPRFLIRKDDFEGAAKSMSRLRSLPPDHPAIIAELNEIKAIHEYEMSLGESTYADCFAPNMIKRLLTGCGIQALQQLTGINFIFYYGTQFFKNSGFENPFLIGLTTNLVNVVSTLPGIYMVERMGRRNLLLIGAIGMCVCEFIVAIVGITVFTDTANKVLVAFVCFYIFFFASSWGPVGWGESLTILPVYIPSLRP